MSTEDPIVRPYDRSNPNAESTGCDRRAFLGRLGTIAASASAVTGLSVAPALLGTPGSEADASETGGPLSPKQRRQEAYKIRVDVAKSNKKTPASDAKDNGDEDLYANRIGNYHKGLPHDANGEVDPAAYQAFLHAIDKGKPSAFEAIPMGMPNPAQRMALVNPQCGIAFDLEGLDVAQFSMPVAPKLASAEEAGEAVELYWMALLRDVHFADYGADAAVASACAELSGLSDFRGPKFGGSVTPQTLFRDNAAGSLAGPYLSQFLLRAVPFGAVNVEQKMRTLMPSTDKMRDYATWLAIQNGALPAEAALFDPVRRYIRNARDLAQWVHIDVLYQAYFHAALILLTPPDAGDSVTGGGIGCSLNPGNPYLASQNQIGFGTFGGPYIMTLLAEVSTRALKAVWYTKWFLNRRLRPEAFGGLVERVKAQGANYPLGSEVLNSSAVAAAFAANNSYLLPMVFPEGSPLHPAYGAGHATVAGACVTILKALFNANTPLANPKVASADGTTLVDYTGPDAGSLTVRGELDKLAANVATGRNLAGVHWRSDGYWSLRLGEQVAISILQDQRATYNEDFGGYTFQRFDGTTITV